MDNSLIVTVSEFIDLLNQTLEFAYPSISIIGELSDFKISKNKWIYFDLKDDKAKARFFGTVYQLPGPLKDGLMLKVRAIPHVHPQYGFSLTVQHIALSGEGSIKQASDLLKAKLIAEGLFADERKRSLPYPPSRIGLITSVESAAYTDFLKIINQRWGGLEIILNNVQVQGEPAIEQIIQAISQFNQMAYPPEVLVITRGGGSVDDLQIFNHELVTRSIAGSRIPTLVAIGHEQDVSLAELAADQRASTPSNAAELLVPDKNSVIEQLKMTRQQMTTHLLHSLQMVQITVADYKKTLQTEISQHITQSHNYLHSRSEIIALLDPQAILKRGYAIIFRQKHTLRQISDFRKDDLINIQLNDGSLEATVNNVIKM
ncbi:MAG TPA: exodeoxyribonuclease VII large subunit [Candidatus Saccharimonadales bacterium]|jgi:exodeoxyribonuclease VII large subunit|nr:exodeoxyribonuclease VII large subunit [Candidatus Saccharimonadales bacterium]